MSEQENPEYTFKEKRQIHNTLARIEKEKAKHLSVYNQYELDFLRGITRETHPRIWDELLDSPARSIRMKQQLKYKPNEDPHSKLCEGVDKNGFRCGTWATKKTKLCQFHSGLMAGTFGKGQRDLTLTEHLREVVREGYAEEVLMPVLDALEAKKTYKVDGFLYESDIPDHDVRLKAHQVIMDRLEGKSEQTTKITGRVEHEMSLMDFMPEATDIVDAEFEELDSAD